MNESTLIDLGIDDTDSIRGMCTTYIAHRLVEQLIAKGTSFEEYPHLIRLNPNIPWKTRGNGAVSIKCRTKYPDEAFEEVCKIVSKYSETEHSADPGVVFSTLEHIPNEILEFAKRALSEVVSRHEAVKLMKKHNIKFKGWGKQRGLIGAIAAIGSPLVEDSTFELIAFRSRENWSKTRSVDPISVIEMSRKTYPYTFNNYDEDKNRVLITPRGFDPVLLGIRGENPRTVLQAFKMLRIGEKVSGHIIFRTNQGTSAHLRSRLFLANLRAYRSGHFEGKITKNPRVGEGGHVYIEVENNEGVSACAAYEPTGNFRNIVRSLIPGDRVEIGGSVRRRTRRHSAIINMEYLLITELANDVYFTNPCCIRCGRRMSSKGKEQGLKCDSCGFKDSKASKVMIEKRRNIDIDLYIPPPRAQRHLTKPKQRYLLQSQAQTDLIDGWFKGLERTTALKIYELYKTGDDEFFWGN